MTQINYIRKMFFEKGMTVADIIKETAHDRKTINKYLEMNDFNQAVPHSKRKRTSKLDPFKAEIDSWLEDDKKQRRKQRHTALRIHNRLQEIHKAEYDCSYRLVAKYVRTRKKEIYNQCKNFYLPLKHIPAEAQVDFGQADFLENKLRIHGYYLNVTFPYSNAGYVQIFKGENQQCLLEGLINIFKYIGGVPTRIWLDNASTMVSKILKDGKRKLTDNFLRFMNHYGFTAAFCNPASGHEKGNVENKVGYHRRNFFVPVPEFKDINKYNQQLLAKSERDIDRPHYKRPDQTIAELFNEDKANLLPLPVVDYDPGEIISKRTDLHACFSLHNGKHRYSTQPRYAKAVVQVKLTAGEVIVMNESFQQIIRHPRLYGNWIQESFNWLPYLTQLSKRPAALKYSGIYGLFPEPVRTYLDGLDREEKKEVLKTIATLSAETSFHKTVDALVGAIQCGAGEWDSIRAIFARQNSKLLEFSSFTPPAKTPDLPKLKANVKNYDTLYLKGVGLNA